MIYQKKRVLSTKSVTAIRLSGPTAAPPLLPHTQGHCSKSTAFGSVLLSHTQLICSISACTVHIQSHVCQQYIHISLHCSQFEVHISGSISFSCNPLDLPIYRSTHWASAWFAHITSPLYLFARVQGNTVLTGSAIRPVQQSAGPLGNGTL